MGSIVGFQCKCGYESLPDGLFLGGGNAEIGTLCNVPYFCDNCKIVDTKNLNKENHLYSSKISDDLFMFGIKKFIKYEKCRRKVQYYGEVKSNMSEDQKKIILIRGLTEEKRYFLYDEFYYCPKCNEVNLKFNSIGCWD